MWYLTSEIDPRIIYVFSSDKLVIIGRSLDAQNCNFAIPDDASISRKHACLCVTSGNLYLEDLGSRYGTFLNSSLEKLASNTKILINENNTIKFGKLNNVWKVNKINFTTCTSTMKEVSLQKLKLDLSQLGGTLKNDWDESCTYLTMPSITLTIKVVLALVQCSSIVTPEYWNKCVEAVSSNSILPNPNDFIPQVTESTLNKENVSFLHDASRKELFAGKQFLFFSQKQLDMYIKVLTKSSASASLLDVKTINKNTLCDDNVIVIQYNLASGSQETPIQHDQISDIVNHLKANGRRVVADAEIGLAVLYCSCIKYCNPTFSFPSEIIKSTETNDKNSKILALDSQEPHRLAKKENVVIEDSLTSEETSQNKRKLSETDSDMPSNVLKKFARQTENITKRKLNDDSSGNANKKLATDKSEEGDDFFNFTSSAVIKNKESNEKTLNFSKIAKRKVEGFGDGDDELFNFVSSKKQKTVPSDSNFIDIPKDLPPKKKVIYDLGDDLSISALRGVKLKELMESNITYNPPIKVKQEVTDELDTKMEKLYLGTTVVKMRSNLIVKKEQNLIEEPNMEVKNFKKFKKVWPIKMQISLVS